MFQSLGINNPKYNHLRKGFAASFAGLILLGNLSFPIMTQANLIDEDERLCQVNDLNSNEEVLACLTKQLEDH